MRRVHLPLLVVAAAIALVGCYSETNDTTATLSTVGTTPEAAPNSLLPVVQDSTSDITTPTPPRALFGGDLCTALVAKDFVSVRIGGLSPGVLVDAGALSPDTCGYTVHSGRTDLSIVVEARTAQDYDQPATTGTPAADVPGAGQGAIGYFKADRTYIVIVKVANGYFSVTTPDSTSAVKLAAIAAGRAAG